MAYSPYSPFLDLKFKKYVFRMGNFFHNKQQCCKVLSLNHKCFVTRKSTVKLCLEMHKKEATTETGGHFTCFNVLWLGSVPNVSEGYYSSVLYVFSLVP